MKEEVKQFRESICTGYKNAGVDIRKNEPYVYDNEQYWEALSQSYAKGGYNYEFLKRVFNSCIRPSKKEIEDYKENPENKVSVTEYAAYDDKMFGITDIYPTEIQPYYNLLDLIYRYEKDEKKHVHKGTIFYFLLEEHLKRNQVEEGLLFINKAFIEDDLKHKDTTAKFPDSPAYKFIVLNSTNPKQALLTIVKDIVNFMDTEFMNRLGYRYEDFWNSFLKESSNKPSVREAHTWLDHVIFFNSFIVRLKKIYDTPSEIFDSIFGEIIYSNIIGDLCLLIESFCKTKLSITGTFKIIYAKLWDHGQKIYNWTGGFINNSDFKGASLENTLNLIFGNNYQSTDPLENSFYLSWGLRNNFHHNIESMSIIKDNFKEIIKKQMEFFFDYTINK